LSNQRALLSGVSRPQHRETLREDERTAAIPVMILSAIHKEAVEERC
jgi:hypothetical protein